MKRSTLATSALVLGALSTVRAALVEAPVQLPPFVVEDKAPLKWHYSQTPEFQILSQCDDSSTREIAERFHRLRSLFDAILPPQLQMKSDVPPTLVLYDEDTLQRGARQARGAFRQATLSWLDSVDSDHPTDVPFLGSMELFDDERASVVLSIPRGGEVRQFDQPYDVHSIQHSPPSEKTQEWTDLSPGYVSHLLSGNQPPLPAWFVAGFLSLFGRLEFDRAMITAQPLEWVSKKDTQSISAHHEIKSGFLPLAELFAEHHLGYAHAQIWLSESDLFIRWALTQGDQKALWAFVDRSRFEPV